MGCRVFWIQTAQKVSGEVLACLFGLQMVDRERLKCNPLRGTAKEHHDRYNDWKVTRRAKEQYNLQRTVELVTIRHD